MRVDDFSTFLNDIQHRILHQTLPRITDINTESLTTSYLCIIYSQRLFLRLLSCAQSTILLHQRFVHSLSP